MHTINEAREQHTAKLSEMTHEAHKTCPCQDFPLRWVVVPAYYRGWVISCPAPRGWNFCGAQGFAALYPLLEASVAIARADPYHLSEHLEPYRQWYRQTLEEARTPEERDGASLSLTAVPALDNYQMIRPGLWWAVLARNRWTCCSCGRSSRRDGVLLEVDHILPRSQGGSNAMHNLRTRCRKCNQGKSDRDSTDLRRQEAEHVLGHS
ncbi:MAG: HNH endonuclease [Candidatus Entotheonellia bacterium]